MKIGIVAAQDVRRWRGGERFAVELAQALSSLGFEVLVFSRSNRSGPFRINIDEIARDWRVRVCTIPTLTMNEGGSSSITVPLPPLDLLRNLSGFDVIYCIDTSVLMLLTLSIACRIRRKGFIFGLHNPRLAIFSREPITQRVWGPLFRLYKASLFVTLRWIPIIHVLNRDAEASLTKLRLGKRVWRIPNFAYWTPKVALDKLNKDFPFRILWIGYLDSKTKGVDILCNVIRSLFEGKDQTFQDSFHFDIVGDSGPDIDSLTRVTSTYLNHVTWHRSVSEVEMKSLYSQADLFLSTSREEAFPLTILEAQSYGIPCIALDIPGVREVICESSVSFLCPPKLNPYECVVEKILMAQGLRGVEPQKWEALRKEVYGSTQSRFGKGRVMERFSQMLLEATQLS